MFIDIGGGTEYIQPSGNRLTISLTDPTGTVTVNQMGIDRDDWFPYVDGGTALVLDADNTAKSIYAPFKLQVVAVGTGVRLYNHGSGRGPVIAGAE